MRRLLVAGAILCALVPAAAVAKGRPRPLRVSGSVSNLPSGARLVPAAVVAVPAAGAGLATTAGASAADGTLAVESGVAGVGYGALDVYGKPASGWAAATAPATFTAPANGSIISDATGDGFVAATEQIGSQAQALVFTRPAAGWGGVLTASATLDVATQSRVLAASGQTLVTGGATPNADPRVFQKPSTGWSGRLAAVATLHPSDGARLFSASVSGNTIVAASATAVYIFIKPAAGWSGAVAQTTRMPIATKGARTGAQTVAAVTLTKNTLVVVGEPITGKDPAADGSPIYVIQRPAASRQHAGAPIPRAYIATTQLVGDNAITGITSSNGTVAVAALGPAEYDHNCPCTAQAWAIEGLTRSASAPLRTPLAASASLPAPADDQIAADGNTFMLGAANGLQLYTAQPVRRPRLTRPSLKRLSPSNGHPALSFTVTAQPNAAPLRTLKLTFGAGLNVTRNAATRRRGVTVNPAKSVKTTSSSTSLTIKLDRPRPRATITIASGALIEQTSLKTALIKIRAHGGRYNVPVTVRTTDTHSQSIQRQLNLTIQR
jgi:hypothetical protein